MAERGYYSLIQFVPDRGRAEGANVGVAVVCPNLSAARVLICEGSEAPKERFGVAVVEQVAAGVGDGRPQASAFGGAVGAANFGDR